VEALPRARVEAANAGSRGSAFLRVAAGAVRRFAQEVQSSGSHGLENGALSAEDLRAILAGRRH
jgi:hypothetical protein